MTSKARGKGIELVTRSVTNTNLLWLGILALLGLLLLLGLGRLWCIDLILIIINSSLALDWLGRYTLSETNDERHDPSGKPCI